MADNKINCLPLSFYKKHCRDVIIFISLQTKLINMAYKKSKEKKYYAKNIYKGGGFASWLNRYGNKLTGATGEAATETGALGLTEGGMGLAGGMASVGGAAVDMFNTGNNASGVGNAMKSLGSAASMIPGIGGLVGAGVGVLGSATNALFGSNLDQGKIDTIERGIRSQSGIMADTSSNDALMSQWGSLNDLDRVSKSDIGSEGLFSNAASKKARSLNESIMLANERAGLAMSQGAANIDTTNDMNILANYSAFGGPINTGQHGGDFSNGIKTFGNGGTHEENPNTGIQIGMDQEGKPNMVEEGEVQFENYIFSNRLKPSKDLLDDYRLPNFGKGKTFAKTAEKLSKESSERPNDPISKNGLFASMAKLIQAQEDVKAKEEPTPNTNQFAVGGNMRFGFGPKYNQERKDRLADRNRRYGELRSRFTLPQEYNMIDDPYNNKTYNPIQWGNQPSIGSLTGDPIFSSYNPQSRKPFDPIGISTPSLINQIQKTANQGQSIQSDVNTGSKIQSTQPIIARKNAPQQSVSIAEGQKNIVSEQTLPAYKTKDFTYAGLTDNLFNKDANKVDFGTRTEAAKSNPRYQFSGQEPNVGSKNSSASYLRYAPAVGSALSVASDMFGLSNKADYSGLDLIDQATRNLSKVKATPVGNKVSYDPFDTDYYTNKLGSNAAGTRRAIKENAGGNRATATAGLLAADASYGSQMGDLARKATESNLQQKMQVEGFNRGTDQFNAQQSLQAQMANQNQDAMKLKAKTTQAQMKAREDASVAAAKSANLTNLFDNLGSIGKEEFAKNMIKGNQALDFTIDSAGNITYKNAKAKKTKKK